MDSTNIWRTSSYRRAVSGNGNATGNRTNIAVRVLPTSDGELKEEAVISDDPGTVINFSSQSHTSTDVHTQQTVDISDGIKTVHTKNEDTLEIDATKTSESAPIQTNLSDREEVESEILYDEVANVSDDNCEDTLVEDNQPENNRHEPLAPVYSVLEVNTNACKELDSRSSTLTSSTNLPIYDDPYKSDIEFPDEIDGVKKKENRSDTLNVYEVVEYGNTQTDDQESGDEISSDDFEPVEVLSSLTPVTTDKRKSKSILHKLNIRTSRKRKSKLYMNSFYYDTEKHPPPVLRPQPDGLTDNQIKRRHVVASVVDIENSYVESLIRLIEKYKKPLIEHCIVPVDKVEVMFYNIEEILEMHLSFQIALQASISEWDEKELIGHDFLSCFSKSIVLEKYSQFANNFMESSDVMRKMTAEKSQFREFINIQAKASHDNLPPHGLMIKIIQRFPQYILQIRDLLKYTGPDHPDYVHLNQALTTLENVAYQLNEGKRQSEYRLAGIRSMHKLGIRNMDSALLRQDDVSEVIYGPNGEVTVQKNRRLLLFEDQICCVKIESDEKMALKWKVSVSQTDYHEVIDIPEPRITETQGVLISSPMSPNNPDLPSTVNHAVSDVSKKLKAEFNELIHDQSVLGKIQLLMSSLKQDYKGLNTNVVQDHLKSVTTSIKLCEEQMTMLDSCTISVSIPPSTLGKNSPRTKLTFQVKSPEVKQDWVLDFRAIKLATEEVNKSLWISEAKMLRPPQLIRTLEVTAGSHQNHSHSLECAVPVYISGASGNVGLQYLWVCSSTCDHGHVTLVSLHSNKPHIIQSFKASDLHINGCCLVPSSIHSSLDHVWLSTINNQISVFSLRNPQKSNILRQFEVPSEVRVMKCIGNHVFIGLSNGTILKYAKRKAGSVRDEVEINDFLSSKIIKCFLHYRTPLYDEPVMKQLSPEYAVNAIVPLSDNKLLTGCGYTFYIMSMLKQLAVLETHTLTDPSLEINKIISVGNGYWFSCIGDPSIRLVHSENFAIPAQERNIGSTLSKFSGTEITQAKDVCVTALASSQGLLWVGVNTGHILTLPMPVLDGIPLSSGPISLCSQKHNGPVKFIIPTKCSLTFAPKPLDELLEENNGSYSNSEIDDASLRSSIDSLNKEGSSKRKSLAVFTSKVKDKLSGLGSSTGLNQTSKLKPSYRSLSNVNTQPPSSNLTRSSDVFGSLMRIDDINENKSTLDLIDTLVPVNGLPAEKVFTLSQLSSERGGSLKVTKSSSISNLTPNNLKDFNKKRKHVAQSMLALNSMASGNRQPLNDDQLLKPKQLRGLPDQNALLADVNLELKQRLGNLERRPNMSALSMGSILSEVAEDEEEIVYDEYGSGMGTWSDDEENADRCSIASYQEEFESSFESSGDLLQSTEVDQEQESHAAYVETNFLKATIIISGGKGLTDIHLDAAVSEPSLILWQQNQT